MKSVLGFLLILSLGCQKASMIPLSPQNYTCPLVMPIYFVVLDGNGKNIISPDSTSVDGLGSLSFLKVTLPDTTKTPAYGGFAAVGASMGPGATFSFTLSVRGVNRGTVSYNITSLGNYYVEGKGCFVINFIKFNGVPISYDKTSGIMVPSYDKTIGIKTFTFWQPPEGIFIFQL